MSIRFYSYSDFLKHALTYFVLVSVCLFRLDGPSQSSQERGEKQHQVMPSTSFGTMLASDQRS